jgi:2-methylisocitrate lyase-like PEP mutase family enzyme
VKLPVIADAEGGFHEAAEIWRTVQAFERRGVAAIHIEDHTGAGKHTARADAARRQDGGRPHRGRGESADNPNS